MQDSMPPIVPSLQKYIRSDMHSVAGYLKTLDAKAIASLLAAQEVGSIKGSVCEIGVHHGRLFFLLALARRSGEAALAIDLFEDDAINRSSRWHQGRDRALFRNAKRLGIPLEESQAWKTSSLEIQPEELLRRTGGPIRFFSIDGGHDYASVANDLALAQATLSPEGIVAIDDFFNVEWPDVSRAAYDFMRTTDRLVPFLLTPVKLYLTTPAFVQTYTEAIRTLGENFRLRSVEFQNHSIALLQHSTTQRIADQLGNVVSQMKVRVRGTR